MGRSRKRSKGPAKASVSAPPASDTRWQQALTEALDILDSWADVADSELTTVLAQLASILRLRSEAADGASGAGASSFPADRLAAAIERACGHDRLEVRSAGWEAAHECSLVEGALCEALVGRGTLCKLGLDQLRAASLTIIPRLDALLAFLQLVCEVSDETASAIGHVEVEALISASSLESATRARAAALELLLVLTDPTALEPDDTSVPATTLICSAEWRQAMKSALTPKSASAAAARSKHTPASEAEHLVSALAAALVLNVAACEPDHPSKTVRGEIKALVEAALRALGETVEQAAASVAPAHEDSPSSPQLPPPDQALRQSLEALANLYVRSSASGEEEEEAAGGDDAMRELVAAILPASELLPRLLSVLPRYIQPIRPPARGSGDDNDDVEEEEDSGVLGRLMRCIGAVLTACTAEELAPAAEAAWRAAMRASAELSSLSAASQREILELWNLLAARCAPDAVELRSVGPAAKLWVRTVQSRATPLAISLLGQFLGLARTASITAPQGGAAAELAAELASELATWLREPRDNEIEVGWVLCAAEAAAALAEDVEAAAKGKLPAPIEALTVRDALERLRKQLKAAVLAACRAQHGKRARDAEEEEEEEDEEATQVAHALELVEAALAPADSTLKSDAATAGASGHS